MKHNTISLTPGTPTPAVIEKEAGGMLGAQSLSLASTPTWRCGHPKTPENTRKAGDGEVRCRICRKVIGERSRQRKLERSMSINGIGRPCNWDTTDPNYRPNMKASNHWRHRAEIACERHLKAMARIFEIHALRSGRPIEHCAVYLMNSVQP